MIRIYFLVLVLIANFTVSAQKTQILPADPAFIAKYANFDFLGNFASVIDKDSANNYFLLDFSKLPTRFERVYFMNLSFSSDELINIGPDITRDQVCFMSNNKYNETSVLIIFDEIKKKVALTSSSWSDEKKSEWLKENDKYK